MPDHQVLANWVRCVYHALLLLIFVFYIAYICEATHFRKQKSYMLLANVIFAAVVLADVITTAQGISFMVDDTGIRFFRRGIFIYGYLAFIVLCCVLIMRVRKLLFHRVMFGFYGTIAVSFLILLLQGIRGQSSFTVSSLLLPVIAMMYILHSNPYDAMLGTNDVNAMQDYVQTRSSAFP